MTSTTLLRSKSGLAVGLRDTGAGEPVILIHGVGMQSAAWGPQINALAQSHNVIALDLPGHGASAPLPVGSQLPDFVTWLRDVITTLQVGPVNIVGHSMGALIAGGYAATYPTLTSRVALLNAVYRRSPQARAAVEERAAEICHGKLDLEAPLTRWFGNNPADRAACHKVAGWLGTVDPIGYATAYTAFAQGDATYADEFHTIRGAFLALTADGDPNSTPAMSQAMACAVQEGQAITISGHRHMMNLTAPEIVTSQLRAWLHRPAAEKETQ